MITVQSEEVFQTTPEMNEHNSVKDTGGKGKKKNMKILFHYPPTFPFI